MHNLKNKKYFLRSAQMIFDFVLKVLFNTWKFDSQIFQNQTPFYYSSQVNLLLYYLT